tara:strand:- start:940 stop:1608 length:669 start_codon:yes stop_codon:yes gene_type:complete
MTKEYTNWTIDKIMNTELIDNDKMFVMSVAEFMHPELYANVMEELNSFTLWRAPEITGRKNYHIGPDQTHPKWIEIARESTWKNKLVNDAIQTKFNLNEDIILGEPLMWQDDNTNSINDVHVDSPAYYYTYQHCLATDSEFAHTGTKFWEVECEYDDAIDEGLDPTFGEDSKLVNMGLQMPYVPNQAYILPRGSRGWHSCPDLTLEADHMERTMVYMIITKA